MNNDKIIVSVCMITYNHGSYIKEAIEGVLAQKTNFPIELVIGEDCSIDSTRSICETYLQKHADIINLLPSKKNNGLMPNFIRTLEACKGKYIALCEGDDYWTDPLKLQKQVDFLDANDDFSICSANVILKNEIDNTEVEWLGAKWREVSTLKDILRYGSGGATCTLVFRSQSIKVIPEWFHLFAGGDWAIQIICTSKGKMRYFRDVVGVYRRNLGGETAPKTIDKTILMFENEGIKQINILNKKFTNYKREINAHAAEYYYYSLASMYSKIGDKKRTRLTIYKIFQQILSINLSFKQICYLMFLYLKNLLP